MFHKLEFFFYKFVFLNSLITEYAGHCCNKCSTVCILATGIFIIVLGSRGDTPGSTGCGHGDHSSQVGLEHISKTGDGVA